ncbi:MAG: MBL fold metallo-hydrolase [Ruminococcaceae bacterium]|nr:MBL fold metallo-hydrolase [Oscillospiraceae bacterium]
MEKTKMYQLTETSPFMMSFVIVTKNDNVIIIDGGREEDMPLLKEYVNGRHISAWILTHAHSDHISGLVSEIKKNGGADFDVEKFYYNFPPYEDAFNTNVPDYEYYKSDFDEQLPQFLEIEPKIKDKAHIVKEGDILVVDECKFEFIFTYRPYLTSNPINDSSLVFKLTTPNKTVLFLGDLGPDGGDILYRESRHLLKSDIVQMAHHGHMNVSMEVYAAIMPEACMWCAPEWLYNEVEIPDYLDKKEKFIKMGRVRMLGTKITRDWMDKLGVKKHYVTKDGTQEIEL